MRLPNPWRRKRKHDPHEARVAVEYAEKLAAIAEQVVERERQLIRENHFGPKIAAALREEHR